MTGAKSPGPDIVVEHRCLALDPQVSWQVYLDGSLAAWTTDPEEAGSAHLVLSHAEPITVWGTRRNELLPSAEGSNVMVSLPGFALQALPPLNDEIPSLNIPHPALLVDTLLTASPAGNLLVRTAYSSDASAMVAIDDRPAEIYIRVPYGAMLAFRVGLIDFFALLEQTQAEGDPPLLSLALGLLDAQRRQLRGDEQRELVRRLCAYSAHLASPDHQARVANPSWRAFEAAT